MTHALIAMKTADHFLDELDLDLGMIGVSILMTNMSVANRL